MCCICIIDLISFPSAGTAAEKIGCQATRVLLLPLWFHIYSITHAYIICNSVIDSEPSALDSVYEMKGGHSQRRRFSLVIISFHFFHLKFKIMRSNWKWNYFCLFRLLKSASAVRGAVANQRGGAAGQQWPATQLPPPAAAAAVGRWRYVVVVGRSGRSMRDAVPSAKPTAPSPFHRAGLVRQQQQRSSQASIRQKSSATGSHNSCQISLQGTVYGIGCYNRSSTRHSFTSIAFASLIFARLPPSGKWKSFFLGKDNHIKGPGEMSTGHISRLNPKWKNLIPIQIWQ